MKLRRGCTNVEQFRQGHALGQAVSPEKDPNAMKCYEGVVEFGDKSGDVDFLFAGYTGLGRVLEETGDYPKVPEVNYICALATTTPVHVVDRFFGSGKGPSNSLIMDTEDTQAKHSVNRFQYNTG
jgi:hypothetical protein